MPEKNTFFKTLKCYLTEEEKAEYSNKIVSLYGKLKDTEEEKSAVAAKFGAKIKDIRHDLSDLAQRHRDGYEYRDVECFVEKNFEDKVALTYREDTMEVVAERPLTSDEKQAELVFSDQGEKDQAEDDAGQEDQEAAG